jgi:hypothetical protein
MLTTATKAAHAVIGVQFAYGPTTDIIGASDTVNLLCEEPFFHVGQDPLQHSVTLMSPEAMHMRQALPNFIAAVLHNRFYSRGWAHVCTRGTRAKADFHVRRGHFTGGPDCGSATRSLRRAVWLYSGKRPPTEEAFVLGGVLRCGDIYRETQLRGSLSKFFRPLSESQLRAGRDIVSAGSPSCSKASA